MIHRTLPSLRPRPTLRSFPSLRSLALRSLALRSLAVAAFSLPIRLYQWCVSPLLPSSCRFSPSCSHYALEALAVHGPIRGLALALRRLSRCHPFTWLGGASGFDPVPPAGSRP